VREPLLQAFPFLSTGKGDTAPVLSGLRVYLQLTWEVGLPSSHKLPAPGCWARAPTPTRASPARPACLFTVPGRIPFPQSLVLSAPTLFPTCLYCCYFLLVSFFFPWWRSVCPGGYAALAQACLWEYHGTAKFTCLRLPKPSGHGRLAAWGPSWFLCLT
jgi:hypothetical protein